MENASLYLGLTFLTWTSVVFLIVVGVFVVKLLIDLSKLMGHVNETASMVEESAKPILRDLTESVSIINSMVKTTEKNVNAVQNIAKKASKIGYFLASKVSSFSAVLAKGLWQTIKSFIKK